MGDKSVLWLLVLPRYAANLYHLIWIHNKVRHKINILFFIHVVLFMSDDLETNWGVLYLGSRIKYTYIDPQSLCLCYFHIVLPLQRNWFKACTKNPVLVVSIESRPPFEIKVSQIERNSYSKVIHITAVGKVPVSSLPVSLSKLGSHPDQAAFQLLDSGDLSASAPRFLRS